MKKVLSIALAIVMVLSVSVVAFADDTVVWSETTMFFSAGNWNSYTIEDPEGFLEALQTEGAVLVITRDAASDVLSGGGTSDTYENFVIIDSWYSNEDYVWLGTAGHTAADEPSKSIIDALSDDGTVATYDAATVYARYVELGLDQGGDPIIISNTSSTAYSISSISVVVPETTEEEAVEDVNASEETTEEASESTETSTASSPDTGVALALVPMAIAGFAVVSTKRR